MVDSIILLIVLVIMIFAVKGTVKHFKGEGPCCQGGSGEVKKEKRLTGKVIGERDIRIGGMHCSSCAIRCENVLNRIDGLKADVDYKTGLAHIRYTRKISESEIRDAVERAGYKFLA